MLSPTVTILRVVITNGTMCCLNCLIIRYTNICPTVESTPMSNMCNKKRWCYNRKWLMGTIYPLTQLAPKERMHTHLFIAVISYIA